MWLESKGLIPDGGQVFGVCALVLIDTITGVAAAVKRGERVRSKRMGHAAIKLLVYLGLIELSLLVTMAVPQGDLKTWVQALVFTVLSLTEAVSILENAATVWPRTGPIQAFARLLRVKRDDILDDGIINNSNKGVS
jgi:hypothetical protein